MTKKKPDMHALKETLRRPMEKLVTWYEGLVEDGPSLFAEELKEINAIIAEVIKEGAPLHFELNEIDLEDQYPLQSGKAIGVNFLSVKGALAQCEIRKGDEVIFQDKGTVRPSGSVTFYLTLPESATKYSITIRGTGVLAPYEETTYVGEFVVIPRRRAKK